MGCKNSQNLKGRCGTDYVPSHQTTAAKPPSVTADPLNPQSKVLPALHTHTYPSAGSPGSKTSPSHRGLPCCRRPGPGGEGSRLVPTATSPHPAGGRPGGSGDDTDGMWLWGCRRLPGAGGEGGPGRRQEAAPLVPGRALGCWQRRASSVPGVATTAQWEQPEGCGVFLVLQQRVSARLGYVTPATSPAGSNKGVVFFFFLRVFAWLLKLLPCCKCCVIM